jgi:hypothetical protein
MSLIQIPLAATLALLALAPWALKPGIEITVGLLNNQGFLRHLLPKYTK